VCVCVYIYIYIHTHTHTLLYQCQKTYFCQSIPLLVKQSLPNTCFISHGQSAKNFLFLSAPEFKRGTQSVYIRSVFCSKKCSNAKLLQSIGDRKMLPEFLYQLSHVNNVLQKKQYTQQWKNHDQKFQCWMKRNYVNIMYLC